MKTLLRKLACVSVLVLGCSHTVAFHPLTQAPQELSASKTNASVRLYMPPELQRATNTFHATMNTWTIGYGARVHEFATLYLPAAFSDFQEVQSPQKPEAPAVLVAIQDVHFLMEDQAAHITMDVQTTSASGAPLFTKEYRGDGWSGVGAALGAGPFAQKGITRSSTDEALKQIFLNLITDLRRETGN